MKKNSGMDERILNESIINLNKDNEKLPIIANFFLKKNLMDQLNSSVIPNIYKLNILNEYSFFDDLNPYALKGYNSSKGLLW